MTPESTNALIVVARAPVAGSVKTRLAAELGAEQALSIYRDLGSRTITAVTAGAEYSITVAFTPDDAGTLVRQWLGPSVALEPQGEGELGERMAAAVTTAYAAGAQRVVLIGTDCPAVTQRVVQDAFHRLRQADVVIGPARDGGYYLIGLAGPHTAVFHDIPWSTSATLRATLDRIRARGLSVALLRMERDIDTAEDWRAWQAAHGQADVSGT